MMTENENAENVAYAEAYNFEAKPSFMMDPSKRDRSNLSLSWKPLIFKTTNWLLIADASLDCYFHGEVGVDFYCENVIGPTV